MPGWVRVERELRSIPLWLLREYLQELGGEALSPERIEGAGWKASLARLEDFQLGSLRVGQVRMILDIDPVIAPTFLPALEKKLLRAGA